MSIMSSVFRLTKMLALAALIPALIGCGFHLRGSGGDSNFAQKLYLDGPGSTSAFAGVFATALTNVGGVVVSNPAQSTAIVYLHRATFQRQPITLSRTGRATGFDLSYRIIFDVRTPKGEIIQPRKEFEVKRDYYNDQSLPLAQTAEEAQINEALGQEAANSLIRRVVNSLRKKPDEPESTPATPTDKKS